MAALESVGGLAGVSRPLTEPPAPMQPKESAIPSMARVLLHSRHCILTEPRMRRSSTGDSCTDYAWPCTLRLRARLRIMFADEARFGRMNHPRPCWAPPSVRPAVASQLIGSVPVPPGLRTQHHPRGPADSR